MLIPGRALHPPDQRGGLKSGELTDAALKPAVQQAVHRLALAVSLAEGFALHLVVVDTRRLLQVVLVQIEREVVHIYPDPVRQSLPSQGPGEGKQEGTLVRELVGKIEVALEGATRQRPLLIDASGDEPWHARAWARVFRRLNEQRNELIRARSAPVLLALHPPLEAIFAANAPDLWSVRGPGLVLTDIYVRCPPGERRT